MCLVGDLTVIRVSPAVTAASLGAPHKTSTPNNPSEVKNANPLFISSLVTSLEENEIFLWIFRIR